jgi:FtsH-binding integral membrane protein
MIMEIPEKLKNNKTFLFYVLLNVIIQLCITYYVMNRNTNPDIHIILLFVIQIGIIILLTAISLPEYAKFLLFTIFSYLFGILFYQLKKKYNYNKDIINTAIMGAISVFASMMVVGILLLSVGIQLGVKFGLFLFFSLLALIISRLVFAFTLTNTHKILTTAGIFLFAGYVIYDTNIILQRNYKKDQYISASLHYYLDFVNLFSNTLQNAN